MSWLKLVFISTSVITIFSRIKFISYLIYQIARGVGVFLKERSLRLIKKVKDGQV